MLVKPTPRPSCCARAFELGKDIDRLEFLLVLELGHDRQCKVVAGATGVARLEVVADAS